MKRRKAGQYENYRDVRGVLFRMLRSGNRSAYATLFYEGLAKLMIPLDLVLRPLERRRLGSAKPCGLPPILIVGMPRAGTTLVCQVLSRYLDVTYLNNLSALFPRSPITATRWFAWLLPKGKPRFTSYFGNTPRLADPNEGFHVWNRWFGSDRYEAAHTIEPQRRGEMTRFFDAWLSTFGKPFLNKSVRNTDAVSVLAATISYSYFVCVRRDPRKVVESLILARQHIQGSRRYGWGPL